jgi:hypothetical protein
MERRLSAIMAADVVGYSRLMGANEVGTLQALKEHRSQLVDPTIAEYQGRIVKLTGDGMLVEFTSVVSAVECAVDVQREMRTSSSMTTIFSATESTSPRDLKASPGQAAWRCRARSAKTSATSSTWSSRTWATRT